MARLSQRIAELGIWGFALGYFLSYVPYSSLTKAITAGHLGGVDGAIPGLALLPLSVGASMIGMVTFISAMGWWKFASRRDVAGRSIPFPGRWTFLSGLCTALIIGTTTLAYTFQGVSIVFMMLLMRGGLLILAPVVDVVSRRHVRWFSWVAVALSLGALVVAFAAKVHWVDGKPVVDGGFGLPLIAVVDVSIYLSAYFVRLRFMSRLAKSEDTDASTRYFVEEQMVAAPTLFLVLAGIALFGSGPSAQLIRGGFTSIADAGGPIAVFYVLLIGLFSQGTGIFGGLILLDRRENTFCVPVNRSSSIMAGIVATVILYLVADGRAPNVHNLLGAALIIAAIVVLTVAPLRAARRAKNCAAR